MKFLCDIEVVNRKKPKNLVDEDSYLFFYELVKELPAVHASDGRKSFIAPTGKLFRGFILDYRQFHMGINLLSLMRSYGESLFSFLSLRSLKRIEEAYFVTNSSSTNFFHWFLDVLQKLELLSTSEDFKSKNKVIVIPVDHRASFIADSLEAFNFKFVMQQRGQLLLVNRLIFMQDLAPSGNYRKDIVLALRDRLRNRFLKRSKEVVGVSRVYITRKNAKKRRIVNEEELIPILLRANFKVVDMDVIQFKEQIELMCNVDVLISLHGAGLTHMLWIKEAASVLEIRARDDSDNNCYFTLASDLRLDYYYALADKVNPSESTQKSDYFIDSNYFKEQLAQLLS
jgi:capsular polysaccharide biosynthesis protein